MTKSKEPAPWWKRETRLGKLMQQYQERFGHPVPPYVLHHYSAPKYGVASPLDDMLIRALEENKPVKEWAEFRPDPNIWY